GEFKSPLLLVLLSTLPTPHSLSDGLESVQTRPILCVRSLRPAPETALTQSGGFLFPWLVMKIERVFAAFINHQHQFVIVTGFGFTAFDLCGEVGRGDFALQHSHVSHLRPGKVHRIAGGVHTVGEMYAHPVVHADVVVRISNADTPGFDWTLK